RRAHGLGRDLVRRPPGARLRRAARRRGRRDAAARRPPLLGDRTRVRRRARGDGPRPGPHGALGRASGLVDVVRARAAREDGPLRAAARPRLAEPLAPDPLLRAAAALGEAVLIGGIVVGVAVLTELRPGTEAPARAAAPPVGAKPPPLPPANAVIDARALGTTAVGLARVPGAATVTLLGPDGTGLDGRSVAIDGTEASRCGPGCYRGPTASAGPVRVVVNGRALRFDVPERAPAAAKLVRALTRRYRSSRTIVFDETLSSGVGNATVTRFTAVAPDRLAYRIRGGPSAIVVGTKRWDRDSATNPWQASGQTPIAVTE